MITKEKLAIYVSSYNAGVEWWNSLPGSKITESFLDAIKTCYCEVSVVKTDEKHGFKYCGTCGLPPKK